MIFGKYINKYYLKYAPNLLLGLFALWAVDYLQLIIPELYQMVINGMNQGYVMVDGVQQAFDMAFLLDKICMPMVGVAVAIVFGRFLWRVSIFGAAIRVETNLRDEMFEDATMHREEGQWQMIFGVATLPEYQKMGCASKLMERVIADVKEQERKGIVLTCKESLIPFYERFGFVNEGKSMSKHGGAVWYDMRLVFEEL